MSSCENLESSKNSEELIDLISDFTELLTDTDKDVDESQSSTTLIFDNSASDSINESVNDATRPLIDEAIRCKSDNTSYCKEGWIRPKQNLTRSQTFEDLDLFQGSKDYFMSLCNSSLVDDLRKTTSEKERKAFCEMQTEHKRSLSVGEQAEKMKFQRIGNSQIFEEASANILIENHSRKRMLVTSDDKINKDLSNYRSKTSLVGFHEMDKRITSLKRATTSPDGKGCDLQKVGDSKIRDYKSFTGITGDQIENFEHLDLEDVNKKDFFFSNVLSQENLSKYNNGILIPFRSVSKENLVGSDLEMHDSFSDLTSSSNCSFENFDTEALATYFTDTVQNADNFPEDTEVNESRLRSGSDRYEKVNSNVKSLNAGSDGKASLNFRTLILQTMEDLDMVGTDSSSAFQESKTMGMKRKMGSDIDQSIVESQKSPIISASKMIRKTGIKQITSSSQTKLSPSSSVQAEGSDLEIKKQGPQDTHLEVKESPISTESIASKRSRTEMKRRKSTTRVSREDIPVVIKKSKIASKEEMVDNKESKEEMVDNKESIDDSLESNTHQENGEESKSHLNKYIKNFDMKKAMASISGIYHTPTIPADEPQRSLLEFYAVRHSSSSSETANKSQSQTNNQIHRGLKKQSTASVVSLAKRNAEAKRSHHRSSDDNVVGKNLTDFLGNKEVDPYLRVKKSLVDYRSEIRQNLQESQIGLNKSTREFRSHLRKSREESEVEHDKLLKALRARTSEASNQTELEGEMEKDSLAELIDQQSSEIESTSLRDRKRSKGYKHMQYKSKSNETTDTVNDIKTQKSVEIINAKTNTDDAKEEDRNKGNLLKNFRSKTITGKASNSNVLNTKSSTSVKNVNQTQITSTSSGNVKASNLNLADNVSVSNVNQKSKEGLKTILENSNVAVKSRSVIHTKNTDKKRSSKILLEIKHPDQDKRSKSNVEINVSNQDIKSNGVVQGKRSTEDRKPTSSDEVKRSTEDRKPTSSDEMKRSTEDRKPTSSVEVKRSTEDSTRTKSKSKTERYENKSSIKKTDYSSENTADKKHFTSETQSGINSKSGSKINEVRSGVDLESENDNALNSNFENNLKTESSSGVVSNSETLQFRPPSNVQFKTSSFNAIGNEEKFPSEVNINDSVAPIKKSEEKLKSANSINIKPLSIEGNKTVSKSFTIVNLDSNVNRNGTIFRSDSNIIIIKDSKANKSRTKVKSASSASTESKQDSSRSETASLTKSNASIPESTYKKSGVSSGSAVNVKDIQLNTGTSTDLKQNESGTEFISTSTISSKGSIEKESSGISFRSGADVIRSRTEINKVNPSKSSLSKMGLSAAESDTSERGRKSTSKSSIQMKHSTETAEESDLNLKVPDANVKKSEIRNKTGSNVTVNVSKIEVNPTSTKEFQPIPNVKDQEISDFIKSPKQGSEILFNTGSKVATNVLVTNLNKSETEPVMTNLKASTQSLASDSQAKSELTVKESNKNISRKARSPSHTTVKVSNTDISDSINRDSKSSIKPEILKTKEGKEESRTNKTIITARSDQKLKELDLNKESQSAVKIITKIPNKVSSQSKSQIKVDSKDFSTDLRLTGVEDLLIPKDPKSYSSQSETKVSKANDSKSHFTPIGSKIRSISEVDWKGHLSHSGLENSLKEAILKNSIELSQNRTDLTSLSTAAVEDSKDHLSHIGSQVSSPSEVVVVVEDFKGYLSGTELSYPSEVIVKDSKGNLSHSKTELSSISIVTVKDPKDHLSQSGTKVSSSKEVIVKESKGHLKHSGAELKSASEVIIKDSKSHVSHTGTQFRSVSEVIVKDSKGHLSQSGIQISFPSDVNVKDSKGHLSGTELKSASEVSKEDKSHSGTEFNLPSKVTSEDSKELLSKSVEESKSGNKDTVTVSSGILNQNMTESKSGNKMNGMKSQWIIDREKRRMYIKDPTIKLTREVRKRSDAAFKSLADAAKSISQSVERSPGYPDTQKYIDSHIKKLTSSAVQKPIYNASQATANLGKPLSSSEVRDSLENANLMHKRKSVVDRPAMPLNIRGVAIKLNDPETASLKNDKSKTFRLPKEPSAKSRPLLLKTGTEKKTISSDLIDKNIPPVSISVSELKSELKFRTMSGSKQSLEKSEGSSNTQVSRSEHHLINGTDGTQSQRHVSFLRSPLESKERMRRSQDNEIKDEDDDEPFEPSSRKLTPKSSSDDEVHLIEYLVQNVIETVNDELNRNEEDDNETRGDRTSNENQHDQ